MIRTDVEETVIHGLLKGLSRRVTYLVSLKMWGYALDSRPWNEPRMIRGLVDEIKVHTYAKDDYPVSF